MSFNVNDRTIWMFSQSKRSFAQDSVEELNDITGNNVSKYFWHELSIDIFVILPLKNNTFCPNFAGIVDVESRYVWSIFHWNCRPNIKKCINIDSEALKIIDHRILVKQSNRKERLWASWFCFLLSYDVSLLKALSTWTGEVEVKGIIKAHFLASISFPSSMHFGQTFKCQYIYIIGLLIKSQSFPLI